jgi:hypothetical protein
VKGLNMAKFSYVPQLLVSHAVLSISTLNSTFQSGNNSLIQIMSYLYTLMQH